MISGLNIETLLAVLVAVQVWIVVLLFAFLFWHRVAREWRDRREEERREKLADTLRLWGSTLAGDGELLEDLRRCSVRVAWEAFESAWSDVPANRRERLRKLVRDSAWFSKVRRAARSIFWWRRLDGAQMLGYLGEREDASTLEKLLHDRQPVVQMGAVFAARNVILPELLAPLIEMLVHATPTRQRALADALLAYEGELVPTLRRRLRQAEDPRELQALLLLAADLPDRVDAPDVADAVVPHARNPHMEVRVKTVKALASYRGPEAESALREAMNDREWQVRAQAAGALGQVRARESTEPLRRALADASWWVRLRAGIALRQLGDQGETVLRQVDADEDPFAHDMAQYALRLDERAVMEHVA